MFLLHFSRFKTFLGFGLSKLKLAAAYFAYAPGMYSLMSQYTIWCAEILSAIKQGIDYQFMMSPADQQTDLLKLMSYLDLKTCIPCPIDIIKGLNDKGQFQYLTKSKGPQEGTYQYTTQFVSLR